MIIQITFFSKFVEYWVMLLRCLLFDLKEIQDGDIKRFTYKPASISLSLVTRNIKFGLKFTGSGNGNNS